MSKQRENNLKCQRAQHLDRQRKQSPQANHVKKNLYESLNLNNDSTLVFQKKEKEIKNDENSLKEQKRQLSEINRSSSIISNQSQKDFKQSPSKCKKSKMQNQESISKLLSQNSLMNIKEEKKEVQSSFCQRNTNKQPLKIKEQNQRLDQQNQNMRSSIQKQNISKQEIAKKGDLEIIKELEESQELEKLVQAEDKKIITQFQENQQNNQDNKDKQSESILAQLQKDNKQERESQKEIIASNIKQENKQKIINITQQNDQNIKGKIDSSQQFQNIAVCIACSKYENILQVLESPKKDLELISKCLSNFNFKIIKCLDKSVDEIEEILTQLKIQIQEEKECKNQIFFYYSGHGGIQKNDANQNVTFGLDFQANRIDLVKYAVELASLPNSVCFAFFDCCRIELKGIERIKQDYSNNLMLLFSCEEYQKAFGTSKGSNMTFEFIQRIKKQDTQKISLSKQICVTEFLDKFKGEFFDNSKCDFILT